MEQHPSNSLYLCWSPWCYNTWNLLSTCESLIISEIYLSNWEGSDKYTFLPHSWLLFFSDASSRPHPLPPRLSSQPPELIGGLWVTATNVGRADFSASRLPEKLVCHITKITNFQHWGVRSIKIFYMQPLHWVFIPISSIPKHGQMLSWNYFTKKLFHWDYTL